MTKLVTFDELIVTIRVPTNLTGPAVKTLARTLKSKPFLDTLRRAVRSSLAAKPSLATVRVRIGR